MNQPRLPAIPHKTRLTDPEDVIYQQVTHGQWDKLCQYTAEGVLLDRALVDIDVRMTVFRSVMRENVAAREKLMLARAEWDNRLWPEPLIEEICIRTAMGDTLKSISEDECFALGGFHRLRMRDDYVDGQFQRARRIAAEGFVDEILTISDDDTNDMGEDSKGGDKPNTAAVQRARLQTDNRKWLAGKLIKEVYGDHQIIEADVSIVVDHAARLEEARLRKEAGSRAQQERLDATSPV